MHNGKIAEFNHLSRAIRNSLKDEVYSWIQGTTDSELAFAVFLDSFEEIPTEFTANTLADSMARTIAKLSEFLDIVETDVFSTFNFAVTDGKSLVVTRYATPPGNTPLSLYYATGEEFGFENDECIIKSEGGDPTGVLVSSEPITEDRTSWKEVPANSMLVVDENLQIETRDLA